MEILNTKKNIVLGSNSPRRSELLKLMGFDFTTRKIHVNEEYPTSLKPVDVALYLSNKKANAQTIHKNEILICADTIVYQKNQIFGKPNSRKEAKKMLTEISNNKHSVVTAVTIKSINKKISFYERSIVYFKELSQQEIQFYIDTFNPLDKAGSYGIQEWIGIIGVKKISGSFYNVMGLPTLKVYEHILEFTK